MNSKKKSNLFIAMLKLINSWITGIRMFIFNVLFIVLIIVIWNGSFNADKADTAKVKKGVLVLNPYGEIVDTVASDHPFSQYMTFEDLGKTPLLDTIAMIVNAVDDPNVTGILIEPQNLAYASISQIQELGDALIQFKLSGKPVIAYGDYFTQTQFLLASYASEVWMHPDGGVDLTGISIYRNYYKSALDKIGFKFDVFKVGKYKSAPNIYTETAMNQDQKAHYKSLINDLWIVARESITSNRKVTVADLSKYVQNLNSLTAEFDGDLAELALNIKLVDKLATRNELNTELASWGGVDNDDFLRPYNATVMSTYINNTDLNNRKQSAPIAVISGSGLIHSGEVAGGMSSDSIIKKIRMARANNKIKAIILRIDSGGGSSLASEKIRKELKLASQAGIKVFVSMSGVAASGGYWVALGADKIWASPATITGSIGVFGLRPNIAGSIDKLGINNDGVGISEFGLASKIERNLTDATKAVIQLSIDHTYAVFTEMVADARAIDIEAVRQLAQGKVYSGFSAKQLKLVDGLGGFLDIIEEVAEIAELKDNRYQIIEEKQDFFDKLKNLSPADLIKSVILGQIDNNAIYDSYQNLVEDELLLLNTSKSVNIFALCQTCNVKL